MPVLTHKLRPEDKLPLTCSRTGTCCHGKKVLLNPWELVRMAKVKQVSARQFRDSYMEWGGIKLKFDGESVYNDESSCSQYIPGFGCSVHSGRPLACRLFPLGRQIQHEKAEYIFQGNMFPCLDGCPVVAELPLLTVQDYLRGQESELYEKAQDGYMELMQIMADIAFVLLLETGLAASGDRETLTLWREMGRENPDVLALRISADWIDALTLPEIPVSDDPVMFIAAHADLLQSKAQEQFGRIQSFRELHNGCVLIMATALHIARCIGASCEELSELWVATAKEHGAME